MKIKKINHLGIVPKDVTQAKLFFEETLGLSNLGHDEVALQKVKVEFISVGDVRVELLEATSSDSSIAKFLKTKGSGIQHIAFEVDDVEAWIAKLRSQGIKMIDEVPRRGAHKTKIAFVHPHSTGGVLVELVQESEPQFSWSSLSQKIRAISAKYRASRSRSRAER